MAEFVVSASMGVMNPLLAKLTMLPGDEYKKLKGLPQEVGFLKRELNAMKALLEKMDIADELDPQAKNWRKDIIDMSYDIEDYIDDFMVRVDEPNDKVGILQKASRRLKTIKDRYRIANQMQEIKARVIEASELRMRYKVDECISSPVSIFIDPRLSSLYLVGIAKQKEDLVQWVIDEGEQLKVLSIVGFGGLGKTTLANEVYHEVKRRFNCNIFVSISQKPDMTRLLSSVLSEQLRLPLPSYAYEVKDLINILNGYLQDKSVYPEDRVINKNELARRWVAEGFVTNSHKQDAWGVAKSFFNELVNRSMIQPVYDKHKLHVSSCRVHDMMLDLIKRRGREDNFIVVEHNNPHALTKVQEKVRRLSVDLSGASDDSIMQASSRSCLSQVRSLAIHGASKSMPAPLSELKFLRVLCLEFTKRVATIDITGIIHLPQLRYLKVEDKTWSPDAPELRILLPSQILKLRYLETLEMPDASVCTIPSDMVELPHLSHLFLPSGMRYPGGIGKMKSLRTWNGFSLHKNTSENIRALGELTNLERLKLFFGKLYWETELRCMDDDDDTPELVAWMPALGSSLGKLVNLRELYMVSIYRTCNGDALSSLSPIFHNLEQLCLLDWNFSRVPRWMGDLHSLRYLRLGLMLNETTASSWEEDIGIIGKLPSLVLLWLRMPIALTERAVIRSSMGFAVLEQLFIECDGISSYLTFEAGAMPILWKLWVSFDPDEWDKVTTPAGLQHLSNLKEIRVSVKRPRSPAEPERTSEEYTSATELIKGVFREAASALPSRPAVFIGF